MGCFCLVNTLTLKPSYPNQEPTNASNVSTLVILQNGALENLSVSTVLGKGTMVGTVYSKEKYMNINVSTVEGNTVLSITDVQSTSNI